MGVQFYSGADASSLLGAASPAEWIRFTGPNNVLELFGVRMLGVDATTGKKVLLTIAFVLMLLLLGKLFGMLALLLTTKTRNDRVVFWSRQGYRLLLALVMFVGVVSIWFSDPTRFATFAGLATAGIAFALQRVVTAFAGYFVILRGKTFNVGDRIVMGGVRGDVIDLGFIQTRIMEMGQPPAMQQADPTMWVRARQYTGRLVTITNDKIFDTPVYNYTKEFPYIWEEMSVPISYKANRLRAEQILLQAAEQIAVNINELSEQAICEMERRYVMRRSEIRPQVFWRLTDNWLELTVRFITLDYGIRQIKDAMSRVIIERFDTEHISIASNTFEVVGLPRLDIRLHRSINENQTGNP